MYSKNRFMNTFGQKGSRRIRTAHVHGSCEYLIYFILLLVRDQLDLTCNTILKLYCFSRLSKFHNMGLSWDRQQYTRCNFLMPCILLTKPSQAISNNNLLPQIPSPSTILIVFPSATIYLLCPLYPVYIRWHLEI